MRISFRAFLRSNVPVVAAGTLFVGALVLVGATAVMAGRDVVEPAKLDAGEAYPGGEATSRKSYKNRNAFSHSSGNLGFKNELLFKVGNGLFRKLWVSSPSSTTSSDGLGPLFNARSCQRCHLKDGRGHTPTANWPDDSQVSMFLRLAVPPKNAAEEKLLASGKVAVLPEPTYGTQLQDLSVQGHKGEGRMDIRYTPRVVKFDDGSEVTLRVPHYSVSNLAYGPLSKDVRISPRVAPQMIGLGLLEAIPAEDIISGADPHDKDGDGISGRANMIWSIKNKQLELGRFGLKAGAVSIKEQSAMAFAGDIGISSSLVPMVFGDCTKAQEFCRGAPHGGDEKLGGAEISDEMLDLVTFYAQNLAVPKRREPGAEAVLKGKALFHATGCAGCHRPSFKTGKSPKNPHLEDQIIWPYSDMLLHDMGEALGDELAEGTASGREWRTPPLWGIGLTNTVSGHEFMLHDGRARNIEEAILWHGGEAAAAQRRYRALSKQERAWLLAFLRSL